MVDALFLDDGRKQDFGIGSNPVLTTKIENYVLKNKICNYKRQNNHCIF
jgi:hypothetical protein